MGTKISVKRVGNLKSCFQIEIHEFQPLLRHIDVFHLHLAHDYMELYCFGGVQNLSRKCIEKCPE